MIDDIINQIMRKYVCYKDNRTEYIGGTGIG